MFENVKNRLRGIATEKQSFKDADRSEYGWTRDARGNRVDTNGNIVGKHPEKEGDDDEDD